MASQVARPHRRGVKLAPGRLDHELARRGITARELSLRTGIHEVSISRAKHGGVITARTLDRITKGLLAFPVVQGVDLLIEAPGNGAADQGETNDAVRPREHSADGNGNGGADAARTQPKV